ncbi:MAG: M14 family zinc carboxypeptidase [Verrucomicrobiota bacterium]
MPNTINYKTVQKPQDFRLFSFERKKGRMAFTSAFYKFTKDPPALVLMHKKENFYPEIYLECVLQVNDLSALMKDEFIIAEDTAYNGWKFYLDRYGHLMFQLRDKAPSYEESVAISHLSLATFVGMTFKVGFTVYGKKLRLLAAKDVNQPMEVLFTVEDFKGLPPFFSKIEPSHLENKSSRIRIQRLTAYNTARFELFQGGAGKPDGCVVKTDFSGASKVFCAYHGNRDLIDIYTGPEFSEATSYWLFVRVTGAVKSKTKLRIHQHLYEKPNMCPVFFWSLDRKKWFRANSSKVTDERGAFNPLLEAPARDFYLASSIPFLEKELQDTVSQLKRLPFVQIANIGRTVEKRDIKLFKLTDGTVPDVKKKHIVLICGQHSPMEMLGAHFLRPMVDYLKKNKTILQKIVLYFVPIVNMDCAHWGGNGSNVNKLNTNRCWFKNFQPETSGILNYFKKLKHKGIKVDYFIDIHAGGTFRNHPLVTYSDNFYIGPTVQNIFKGKADAQKIIHEKHRALKLLEQYAGLRTIDSFEVNFRRATAHDYFRLAYPEAMAFSLELGTSSYFDPIKKESRIVDQPSLRIVGEGLLKAILAHICTDAPE